MRYLSRSMYERILHAGLREHGLPPIVAQRLIDARWPMNLAGILAEADGRGLVITREDLVEALADLLPNAAFDFEEVLFAADIVELVFGWLVEHDRATPTAAGRLYQQDDSWVKRKFGSEPAADAASTNLN